MTDSAQADEDQTAADFQKRGLVMQGCVSVSDR